MTTLITRVVPPPTGSAKGSPLTNVEMDDNLIALDNTKAETSVVALKAPIDSPVFTGNPQAPNPVSTDNDTSIATTSFVQTVSLNNAIAMAIALG